MPKFLAACATRPIDLNLRSQSFRPTQESPRPIAVSPFPPIASLQPQLQLPDRHIPPPPLVITQMASGANRD